MSVRLLQSKHSSIDRVRFRSWSRLEQFFPAFDLTVVRILDFHPTRTTITRDVCRAFHFATIPSKSSSQAFANEKHALAKNDSGEAKVDPYEPTAGESRVLEELQQGVYTLAIRGAEARCAATTQIQITPKSSRTITAHLFSMTERDTKPNISRFCYCENSKQKWHSK